MSAPWATITRWTVWPLMSMPRMALGVLLGLVGGLRDLDAAGLAAAADLDLRLDDDDPADALGRGPRLLRRRGDLAGEHGHAVLLEHVSRLVLVQIHVCLTSSCSAGPGSRRARRRRRRARQPYRRAGAASPARTRGPGDRRHPAARRAGPCGARAGARRTAPVTGRRARRSRPRPSPRPAVDGSVGSTTARPGGLVSPWTTWTTARDRNDADRSTEQRRGPDEAGPPGSRVVIAKPGLDGHDRGAKVVARALRDAGVEVVYTGLHQTPEQIVAAVVQEDADAVGLSVLSGAHMTLFPRVIQLLAEQGADDVVVFGGGIIPEADIPLLQEQGVAMVFTPGTTMASIVDWVRENV